MTAGSLTHKLQQLTDCPSCSTPRATTGQEAPAVPDHCTARHQGGPERCGALQQHLGSARVSRALHAHWQHVLPVAFQPRHQQGDRCSPNTASAWCCLPAVLSARLGCGKGGLSWGSEELLAESLQASAHCCAGCVHPIHIQSGCCQSAIQPPCHALYPSWRRGTFVGIDTC